MTCTNPSQWCKQFWLARKRRSSSSSVGSNIAEPGAPVCQQQYDIEIYLPLFIEGCGHFTYITKQYVYIPVYISIPVNNRKYNIRILKFNILKHLQITLYTWGKKRRGAKIHPKRHGKWTKKMEINSTLQLSCSCMSWKGFPFASTPISTMNSWCITKKTVSLPKGNIPNDEFKHTIMFQLFWTYFEPNSLVCYFWHPRKKGAATKRYTNTSRPKAPVGEVCPLGWHAFFAAQGTHAVDH